MYILPFTKDTMSKKPIIAYQFINVSQDKEKLVKDIVEKNLDGKMDSYFKKIYTKKETAEIRIDYTIQEDKKGKYEGSFKFNYDGKNFLYTNKRAFKFVEDIVNHAFKRFKEFLSKQPD